MLKLFHSPGACSDGILVLLEEIGAAYEVEIIDLAKGMQRDPTFLQKNPKGKVPSIIRSDGSCLTEFQTISYWLAREFNQSGIWPDDLEGQCRTLEVVDFIVSSVHMRGFTFVRVPKKFELNEQGTLDLQQYGRSEAEKGLSHLSEVLGDQDYLLGDFGVADTAAFYVLQWAEEAEIPLKQNMNLLLKRLRQRPAFQRAIQN